MNNFAQLSLYQVAEVELVYRNKVRPSDRVKVTEPSSAYDVFMAVWDMNKIELVEQAKILLLDSSCKCLGVVDLSTGGVTACLVDPRIVFSVALAARATSIIIAHNHPSEHLQPSKADKQITERLSAGGQLLDIKLSDHLIISPHGYYSMSEHGLMPR